MGLIFPFPTTSLFLLLIVLLLLTVTAACACIAFPWSKLHACWQQPNSGSWYLRIIESLESEGTPEGHLVQLPCNEQGHRSYIRLPRALSSLALKVSRDGASITALGNLFQCLTVFTVNIFFCISNLNLPSSSLNHRIIKVGKTAKVM